MNEHAGQTPVGRRHPRLVELVTDEVRRLIVSGRWPQGQRLVEAQVADELGVSRNPVREALRSLEAEGFVELSPRRGARVAVLSPLEAGELFEVRGALEELAAGLAARRRTAAAVGSLEAVVTAGHDAVAAGRLDELPALNTRFHLALLAAGGNGELASIMRPLRDRIQWVYAVRIRDRAPHSWSEHEAIVTAVVAGDESEARRLAGAHIAAAREAYFAVTDAQPSR